MSYRTTFYAFACIFMSFSHRKVHRSRSFYYLKSSYCLFLFGILSVFAFLFNFVLNDALIKRNNKDELETSLRIRIGETYKRHAIECSWRKVSNIYWTYLLGIMRSWLLFTSVYASICMKRNWWSHIVLFVRRFVYMRSFYRCNEECEVFCCIFYRFLNLLLLKLNFCISLFLGL